MGASVPRIGAIRILHLVAAAVAKREGGTSSTEAFEQIGQIVEAVCHDMNDITLALHAAMAGEHAGGQNDAALPFEQAGPDDEVGNAGLVFDGDVSRISLFDGLPVTEFDALPASTSGLL
jgi:hypothetical protein